MTDGPGCAFPHGSAARVTDRTPGVFQNQELQDLDNKLVAQGEESVEGAIQSGALLEELDIADLQKLLEGTESEDLRLVYENLQSGSRNHLRAFARQLQRHNATYEARHL